MEFLRSFLRRHFAGKPEVASPNVGCFLRLAKPWTFDSDCLGNVVAADASRFPNSLNKPYHQDDFTTEPNLSQVIKVGKVPYRRFQL